jgi:hypothetical protein
MIKVITTKENAKPKVIPMSSLAPLQIARIHAPGGSYHGDLVMRTQSKFHHEVMNLTRTYPGGGWSRADDTTFRVVPLPPGEVVTVEISNPA